MALLVNVQRKALLEIRMLLGRFVRAELEPAEFLPEYRSLFGPFDPPDLTMSGLSQTEQNELSLYIKLMGGWFGEDDGLVPRRADWEYGKDMGAYSWIDGPAYRRWIRVAAAEAGIDL